MRALVFGLTLCSSPAWAVPLFVPVQQSTPSDLTTSKSLIVTCPAGRVAVSGGAEVTGASNGVALNVSGPEGVPTAPDQWFGGAMSLTRPAGPWGITVNALCAAPAVAAQIQVVTVLNPLPVGSTFVDATATCPAGTSVISGGARIYGAVNGAALTTNGPEGTDRWYGVATLPAGANAGVRVDAFCLPNALWTQKITQVTQLVNPVAGYAADAAVCPRRTYALGGGARVAGPIGGVALQATNPDPLVGAPLAWSTAAAEVGAATPGWVLRTDAFCLRQ